MIKIFEIEEFPGNFVCFACSTWKVVHVLFICWRSTCKFLLKRFKNVYMSSFTQEVAEHPTMKSIQRF